jgi:hypothetical protein
VEADMQDSASGKSGKQAQMAAGMALMRWMGTGVGKFRAPKATR